MWIRNSTLLQSTLRSLAALLFFLFPCGAFTAPVGAEGISSGQSIGIEGIRNSGVAAVGYTGPGDVIAGASAYYGVRAYTSATRGNKLMNVCNSTGGVDVGCADMFSDASTGALVPATINGITCPGANCTVKTAYDLTGGTACGGAACDATNATVASRPRLSANVVGTLPCMVFASASSQFIENATGAAITLPVSMALVATRTANFTTAQQAFVIGGNGPMIRYTTSANTISLFDQGADITGTGADSTTHRLLGMIVNGGGATTTLSIDNVSTTGAVGVQNAGTFIIIGSGNGAVFMDGNICEAGIWSGNKSANFSTLDANMKSYYGL